MSLTRDDLTAIRGVFDTSMDVAIEEKIRPLVVETVNTAVNAAIETLALQVGAGFNEVSERFGRVEADIAVLKDDVAELKFDVAELKVDVAVLKVDVAGLKTDAAVLKVDMREVKWGLGDTVRRGEFLDVRTRMERLEAGA